MLSSVLCQVEADDPATFAGAVLLLGVVGASAFLAAAMHAARLDPLVALREDSLQILERFTPNRGLGYLNMMTGHSERIGLGGTTLADEDSFAQCEERFAALVNRQSRFVFRVAYAVLRNSHDAEDVAQEVFLKLYRSRRWDEIEDERAYLARVTWRVAMDRQAKAGRAHAALNGESPSHGETPEQAAVHANWAAVVHRFMDALPAELRQPLALSAVDDLKSFEIARILGIPEGTVRTRLMKAREVLKRKLSRVIGEPYGR